MSTLGAAFSALLNTFTGAISLVQQWRQPGDAQSRRNNASMRSGKSSVSHWYTAMFSRKDRPIEKEDPAPRSSLRRIVRTLRETLAFVFRSFSSRPAKRRDYDILPDASESSKSHATKSKSDHSYRTELRASKSSRRSTGRPTSTRSHGSSGSISHRPSSKSIVLEEDERKERKSHRSKDEKRGADKDDRKSEKRLSRPSPSSTRSTKSDDVITEKRRRERTSDYGDGIKISRSSTSRRHEERKERKSSGLSSLLKRKKL